MKVSFTAAQAAIKFGGNPGRITEHEGGIRLTWDNGRHSLMLDFDQRGKASVTTEVNGVLTKPQISPKQALVEWYNEH